MTTTKSVGAAHALFFVVVTLSVASSVPKL